MPPLSQNFRSSGPFTLLLVSDHAEEIKRITITMRGFFPGCRIETVYTAEEALEWASKQDWHLILIDEQLPGRSGADIIPELRERARNSAIIVQLERNETAAGLQAMHAGADLALFKPSPTLLTELPILAREVLDKRELRTKLDLSDRAFKLIEDLTDFVYELDPEGRFLYVSPETVSRLGYKPEELIGAHYSTLLQPIHQQPGNRRLNERRTGARASRNIEVRLLAKRGTSSAIEALEMEVASSGLYSDGHAFVGSIGVARDITRRKQEQAKLHQLERLQTPLASILRESEQLMMRLTELQLDQQLRSVAADAAQLADLSRELLANLQPASPTAFHGAQESFHRDTPPPTGDPDRPAGGWPASKDALEDRLESSYATRVAVAPQRETAQSAQHAGASQHPDSSLAPDHTAVPTDEDRPPVSQPVVEGDLTTPQQERSKTAAQGISLRGLTHRADTERRRFPRTELELEAKLEENGSAWEGRVVNMSLGGLYMVFHGSIAAQHDQSVQLGLGGEGGILEMYGRIRQVRARELHSEPGRYSSTGLAIEFTGLGAIEQRILASILEGLHEGSITVKLTGMLVTEDRKDLVGESPSSTTTPQQSGHSDLSSSERRIAARVNVAIPVSVAAPGTSLNTPQGAAQTTNMSVTGTCVRMTRSSDLLGRRILLRLSPSPELLRASGQSPTEPSCTVMGEVIWIAPETLPDHEQDAVRLGIRFLHVKEESRRRISGLVGHLLKVPGRSERWEHETEVLSDLTACHNHRGQHIAMYHDYTRAMTAPGAPALIISPGYGETKKDYVGLAYHVARNDFHVFRYDHSNHVGESEGTVTHTTLSGMKDDLLAVIEHVEQTCPASPIAVVAMNVAARTALKAATQDARIKFLVVVAGVVDVQNTLREAHQEDYVATYLHGAERGTANILGLNVDADHWLDDAVKQGYADLRTTLSDAAQIASPVVWFVAHHDSWVRDTAVKEVHTALGNKLVAVYSMPAPLHRFPQDAESPLQVFHHIVYHCRQAFSSLSSDIGFHKPAEREIGLQARVEIERARAVHRMGTAESIEFWRDYLAQFHYIANFPDYWHLLEQVSGLMGGPDKHARVLDAGCGNGNFGMFMLINQAYRQQLPSPATSSVLHYVAVDFVPNALAQTRRNLHSISEDLQARFPSDAQALINVSLIRADLNMVLPFRPDQFDSIICNLVIGYLDDPLFSLRELLRVLAPKGRLVLTNLKPDADLTQIYRNFIPFATPGEEEEAKRVLCTTGKIQEGQRDGRFQSLDRQTLARLLMSSGAVHPRIYSAFANQAFIAVAEKPAR